MGNTGPPANLDYPDASTILATTPVEAAFKTLATEVNSQFTTIAAAAPTGNATTDTATISAAAAAGRRVQLGAGTYMVNASCPVAPNTTLVGNGKGTVIQTALTTTTTILSVGAATGVTIADILFSATVDNTAQLLAIAVVAGADVEITRCRFTGRWRNAVQCASAASDVRIVGCHFDSIGWLTTSTPGDAIAISASSQVTVTGCTFINCKQDACYFASGSTDCSFTGNAIIGSPEGVQVRVSCARIAITGNTIDLIPSTAVTSFGIILQTDSTDCTVTGNTINGSAGAGSPLAAVSVDTRCHRTLVAANTISGNLGGVKIETTGAPGTESHDCVVADNTLNNISVATQAAILVGASEDRATVAANSIVGGSNRGIQVVANRVAVTGNKVQGCAGFNGIDVTGNYCTIVGNHVSDVAARAGIRIAGTNSTVTGNTCYNNNTYGIWEDTGGNSNVIVANNCLGNLGASDIPAATGAATLINFNLGRTTPQYTLSAGAVVGVPARAGQLVDNSGGVSGGGTIAVIGTGAAAANQSDTANAVATLAARLNAIEAKLSAAGGGVGVTA